MIGRLDVFDQLHNDFSVGLASEFASVFFQRLFQHAVVFDSAVVDYGDFTAGAELRVSVYVVRFPMCCPSGVGDAHRSCDILRFTERFQVINFALGFVDVQFVVVVDQRHSRAVIPSVL